MEEKKNASKETLTGPAHHLELRVVFNMKDREAAKVAAYLYDSLIRRIASEVASECKLFVQSLFDTCKPDEGGAEPRKADGKPTASKPRKSAKTARGGK